MPIRTLVPVILAAAVVACSNASVSSEGTAGADTGVSDVSPDVDADDASDAQTDQDTTDTALPDVDTWTPPCTPIEETCDGLDNDCDGEVDEIGCPCLGIEVCYGGPMQTFNTGECQTGTRECDNFGEAYLECEGWVGPVEESCDGLDNDCDGEIDNGVRNACGTCGPEPLEDCWDAVDNDCDGLVDEDCCQAEDTCGDGIDNDCDGVVDDGCDGCTPEGETAIDDDGDGEVDEDCPCADGDTQACCAGGIQICEAGEWGPCLGAADPTEICGDGIDQDCDGEDLECPTVEELCDSEPHLLTSTSVFFPEHRDCAWGVDGNGSRDQYGRFTARNEIAREAALPEGTVICHVDFNVPDTDMWFDDDFLITFNDVILASNFRPEGVFDNDGGLFIYEWLRLRGADAVTEHYCLGGADTCEIPTSQTDDMEPLSFDVSPAISMLLAARALREDRATFTMIASGNRSDDDCVNTAFTIELAVDYVLMP